MIFKNCPLCGNELIKERYTNLDILGCDTKTGSHRVSIYDFDYFNEPKLYTYINSKLIYYYQYGTGRSFVDEFGGKESGISSVAEYIDLIKRYYKLMAFL